MGQAATWVVLPKGERDLARGLVTRHSGESAHLASGVYDVGVFYQEDAARRVLWMPKVSLSGTVTETVDLGLDLAKVRLRLTSGGVDVGDRGEWGLYPVGERYRDGHLGWKHSDETLTIAAGTYDVGAFYQSGNARVGQWLPRVEVRGSVDSTLELGTPQAQVRVRVSRHGNPPKGAWCGFYPDGPAGGYTAWAQNGEWLKTAEGTYDIGCFHSEQGLGAGTWLKSQVVKGKVELVVELGLRPASLTVTAPSGQAPRVTMPAIALVVDGSSTMWAQVEGTTRIEALQQALSDMIHRLPDRGVDVALRAYGTTGSGTDGDTCTDSTLLVPRGPIDKASLDEAIATIEPNAAAPIAYTLDQVGGSLGADAPGALVLIADGGDTCNGDPCAAAARLAADGRLARSFVVGFGVGADRRSTLDCVGRYYPASSRAELARALGAITDEVLRPVTGTVAVFPTGRRDTVAAIGGLGDRLVVQNGSYDVVIRTPQRSVTWTGVPIDGDLTGPVADTPPKRGQTK